MKQLNILFFSRSELTFLYGSLNDSLKDFFNIIHVAYSEYEANILKNQFGIDEVIILKEVGKKYLGLTPDQHDLELIDKLLIEQTNGAFNLNAALQSNRSSKYIGYNNSVKAAFNYYKSWDEIFKVARIDFFIHEPVSLMMNQMAAAICKREGGVYSTHIMVQGDANAYNFIMVDNYKGQPVELEKLYKNLNAEKIAQEKIRITGFLEKFRSSYAIFLSSLGNGNAGFKLRMNLSKAYIKQLLKNKIKPGRFDPVLDNIELFIDRDNLTERRLKNIGKYKELRYDEPDPSLAYYFYPLHLEPEAVVLYWADGLYTNQIKLIENIAAQLPAGVFLYVKDHPHLYGYRDISDYERIQGIPNVKLLKPSISGKQIIKDCKGVITINGTGGFEGLLMNKHVITFGSSFYGVCKRVIHIDNIKDLREKLYSLKEVTYEDDDELYRFILAYLLAQKEGFTDFYGGMHLSLAKDSQENISKLAKGFTEFFNNYNN